MGIVSGFRRRALYYRGYDEDRTGPRTELPIFSYRGHGQDAVTQDRVSRWDRLWPGLCKVLMCAPSVATWLARRKTSRSTCASILEKNPMPALGAPTAPLRTATWGHTFEEFTHSLYCLLNSNSQWQIKKGMGLAHPVLPFLWTEKF